MFFLVNTDKKFIFGWSAKCRCTNIKDIFYFLQTDNLIITDDEYDEYDEKAKRKIDENVKHDKNYKLPNDIENYTTIIFIRNPYKRIVSGFIDKYRKNGEFRCRIPPFGWKNNSFLSFSQFVDDLIIHRWEKIDEHHFTPQTTENFDEKILLSKNIKFYDICKIDFEYIEQLLNKKIPESIRNKKYGHERIYEIKDKDSYYNDYVYDLNIDDYIDKNVDIKYFYNQEIKDKVFNFYIKDFNLFKEHGIDYVNKEV
tara:strand:+ start:571 stop:1335 length:765 start_codon:yes stop_codon:yes gene_type:complete